MRNKLTKRMIAWLLVVVMLFGLVPETTLNAYAADLSFGVANPDGYVTVSFTDNGVRPENAAIENEELYGTALGTIIQETKVPYKKGDNIATITDRLLDAMGMEYESTGSLADGFYLSAIKNFEHNGKFYESLGEFDAGSQSGWCIRLNNWHINQGASSFEVADGDEIKWLYTCQFGADVGADFSKKSAEITGIQFKENYGTLSPAFSKETESYTYEVPMNTESLAFEVLLDNYASATTVKVDGNKITYRPNQSIAVGKNSKIEISTELEYMDAANNNAITTYTDKIEIQLVHPNQAPVVVENAPTTLEATAEEEFTVDFKNFFKDEDGDELTYTVKIESLGLEETLDGSVYKGTFPTAGTYEVVITASDESESVSHVVTLNVGEAKKNTAPNIKAAYAEEKGKTYIYSSSYVYIYMEDIFEDADGDGLTYKATCDGEAVDITYNSWSKEHYIQFASKPTVKEYKIVANDGKADSEVFTAKCIGTSATIKAPKDSVLIENGNYYYYVKGSAENDTFELDYELDVDETLTTEWTTSNKNILTSNGNGTFTVNDITRREQPYVGVTCGKDDWGSDLYLGTKYIYLLPSYPTMEDITLKMPEHEDTLKVTDVSNAITGGWYTSEFNYKLENPEIADITTSGSYGLKMTPKALGTTKVTATFKYDESIQTSFNITVTGRSLQIKGQPGEDSVIFKEGKTVQMEVLGAVDGETFTWTSGDEEVATVDENGLVTIKKLGPVYITAKSSLSTEEEPMKASMYLQIKEAEKAYLDDLAITDYTYMEGDEWISAKAGFNSSQLTYDWSLQSSRYTYNKLAFTPYFDDENLKAVLHYKVNGLEEQTKELANGSAVSITNGLAPGENAVKIEVSPKNDETNITTYTLNIFRPYNPSNTISRMTIYPSGETALAYPTYLDNKEGTIFQWDEANDDFVTGWNGKPATGWSSSRYTYKTFVYGKRTQAISVYPTFAYANQRVQIWVNGKYLEEAVTNWKSSLIEVGDETTEVVFKVVSEKYFAEETAKGNNPFETPEKTYTLYVESVTPLGIDAEILSAELENGEFYEPGFDSTKYTISALIPSDAKSTNLTFTVANGIDVYKGSVSAANKLESIGQDEKGNSIYKTETTTITGTGMNAYSTTNIILQVTDEEGNIGKTQYSFTTLQRGEKDVYPDEVVEYLCIGSQYTNLSSYGTMPERTLKNGGGTLSLGNFGGYVTYKYEKPIENNPNNPYGVDFVAYGNSFGNGGHEPGYVQVSKDGKTWYTLAGSEHFDDHNDWGFSMTYTNNSGKSAWTNSDGESGEIYRYPNPSAYPYFDWTEDAEKSMTVTGARLNSSAKDAYGSAAAVLPVFGYVDVNTNGTINGTSNNPYNHPGTLVDGGDMFDLDWAVDENGMPVDLDSVSYIRVATASSIYAGAIGEKSTEVSTINRVTNAEESAVGKTEAPKAIKVNSKKIENADEQNVYTVQYDSGELIVDVDVPEGTNVYINNAYGTSRTYQTAPEKRMIRIIVQEEEKEPYIAYVVLKTQDEIDQQTADEVIEKIDAIGEVTLESEEAIKEARAAYDKLTKEQKEKVTNYDVLVAAEQRLAELKAEAQDLVNIYKTTGKYLSRLTNDTAPTVGTIGGEWIVLGLARSGYEIPEEYYQNVIKYVTENINEKDQLHRNKSTDNARVILALTSAGYDVTDVAGHNLLNGLTDMNYLLRQGINGPIWALIAFDSHDYEIPTAEKGAKQVTRESLINQILDMQFEDGGWALSGTSADTDMTAMAIQALAPYYETNNEVKSAIDKALNRLSKMQLKNGGFVSAGDENAESSAQVIVALTALGIDPTEDERFIKNGNSVLDALCEYYVTNGGFSHLIDGKRDGMATEQGYYALVSYFRFLNGQTSLYDMSDVELVIDNPSYEEEEETENPEDEEIENPEDEETENPEDEETENPEDEETENKENKENTENKEDKNNNGKNETTVSDSKVASGTTKSLSNDKKDARDEKDSKEETDEEEEMEEEFEATAVLTDDVVEENESEFPWIWICVGILGVTALIIVAAKKKKEEEE